MGTRQGDVHTAHLLLPISPCNSIISGKSEAWIMRGRLVPIVESKLQLEVNLAENHRYPKTRHWLSYA